MSSAIRRRPDDKDLEKMLNPAEAIFTSSGNNDSGLWEPNLRDERYLPFEGAGAVNSEWRLDLPAKVRQFDYSTITDVVLHIRYTAEPGSDPTKAEEDLARKLREAKAMEGVLWAYTSLRSDLADQFAALARELEGRPIKLKLPMELARWMGQPIEPTGDVKIAVLGGSQGDPTVRFVGADLVVKRVSGADGYWTADRKLENPKALLADSGIELSIRGMSELRDVVIYFAGKVKA